MQIDLADAFEKWGRDIYAFAYLRLSDHALAQDVAQEVFMRAWRSRETFDAKKSSLKTWLFVIARKVLVEVYENKKMEVQELDENIAEDLDVAGEVENKMLIDSVLEKMDLLSEREREIVILRYKFDYKLSEVAKIMGMSTVNIKVTLHRAMKKLVTFLNKSGYTTPEDN